MTQATLDTATSATPAAGARTGHEVGADERPGSRLHAVDIHSQQHRAEAAVADLLRALGRDITTEHLADTPRRVAASLIELLTPREFHFTTFPNDEGYEGLVLVRNIPFHSLCEHHVLPFRGVAHVGYLPGDRLVGLSKLARIVEHFARDLQVQERLTMNIATYLSERLAPRGVGVVLEAEHLCMSLRGVQAAGAVTTTSEFTGELRDDEAQRRRFHIADPLAG